jgi:DNA adenine methylase
MSPRTPLTYYGGKQKLAARVVAMMPPHVTYLEPFCGGAAVLFAKPRAQRETINDLDGSVMRFWRALRERPEELAAAVALTPYGRSEWQASSDSDIDDDVEAARRFLVNVDQSFSRGRKSWSPPSLLRDRRGRWQPGTWGNLPAKIRVAAERLSGVCLESGNALKMIARWDHPGGLIYVDPPYVGEHRLNPKSHCYTHDAGPDLWTDLVEVLLSIENSAVILSGYPCDEAELLCENGWKRLGLRANRNVRAARDVKLGTAPETVWLSPTVTAPINDQLWMAT